MVKLSTLLLNFNYGKLLVKQLNIDPVRKYLDTDLNEEKVKNCIKNATLAPNSRH